ncbi:MAG: hypothetical protein HDQ91_00835 [Desulfovibrio sp.]|nr:hypothetical protein [Desulfovibrio sp.]
MLNRELLLAAGGGDPLNGVIGPAYDYHGFKLQRHISDLATVITYKAADGATKRMAVLDAKFRSVQQFGTYGINVPGLANFNTQGKNGWYIAGDSSIPNMQPMPDSVTNDAIFTNWADTLKTDKTAKANCDIWMFYNDKEDKLVQSIKGVPAVAWCRAQTLVGKPCDLGNLYQNIVIFACGDKLDEMDKTASEYPNLRLGYTSTTAWPGFGRCQKYNGQRTDRRFSSTEYATNSERVVGYGGNCGSIFKYNLGAVVPILELD